MKNENYFRNQTVNTSYDEKIIEKIDNFIFQTSGFN